jgi:predicted nucleic acid-binding protein
VASGRLLRVFFDADVLIAGAASATGASHVLLRLSEFGLIEGLTCDQVLREADRNLEAKLPAALPAFRAIIAAASIAVVPEVGQEARETLRGRAHEDDLPILAAALAGESDYLTTFNVRHYRVSPGRLRVSRPGDVLAALRRALMGSAD